MGASFEIKQCISQAVHMLLYKAVKVATVSSPQRTRVQFCHGAAWHSAWLMMNSSDPVLLSAF